MNLEVLDDPGPRGLESGLDPVTGAFFLAFVVGAGFSVLGFALGAAKRVHGHHGRAAHGPRAGATRLHHGRPSPGHHGILSRLPAPVLDVGAWAALACVTGAAGYLLRRSGWSGWAALLAALPPGLAAALALHALGRWLAASSGWLAPARLEGSLARIVAPVRVGGVGEILVTVRGARRALAARTTHGRALARGEEVVIVSLDRGVAWVEPLSPVEEGVS